MKYLLTLLLLIVLIESCTKDATSNTSPNSNVSDTLIVINSLSKTSAKAYTKVTVFGKNFLLDTINQYIKINGKKIILSKATKDSVSFIVPLGVGSGNVILNVKGIDYNGPFFDYLKSWVVSTFAGSTTKGYIDGQGSAARFSHPWDVAIDGSNNLYVVDGWNNRIRKITPSGWVSTIAGNGISGTADGIALSSQISPRGIAASVNGDVYFSDMNCIRKVSNGYVTTVAGNKDYTGLTDGNGINARLNPAALTSDKNGNIYFVQFAASFTSSPVAIRKMTSNYQISTLTTSSLLASLPRGITYSIDGYLYVTNEWRFSILKLNPNNGNTIVYAGQDATGTHSCLDGQSTSASIGYGYGITSNGNKEIFFIDQGCNNIKKISTSGYVSAFASMEGYITSTPNYHFGIQGYQDGDVFYARFFTPKGIVADTNGNLFVADAGNNSIRKISYE